MALSTDTDRHRQQTLLPLMGLLILKRARPKIEHVPWGPFFVVSVLQMVENTR